MFGAEFSVMYHIHPDYLVQTSVSLVKKTNGHDANQLYALKSVSLPSKRCLQRERDILSFCASRPSPFIQRLHYAFQSAAPLAAHLVTDIYPGGSLETFMDERNDIRFSDTEGRFYIAEVVCAVEYLHSNLIVHADVKMSNVFIKADGHVVLGDFDCAHKLDSEDAYVHGIKGTAKYMAPEVPSEKFSFPVDIWCIGMLAVDLMVEDPRTILLEWPWEKVASIVKRGFALKPKVMNKVPQKLRSFIAATLQKDPSNRPCVTELKSLRYLNCLLPRWEDTVRGARMTPPFTDQRRVVLQPREFDGGLVREAVGESEWLTSYRLKDDTKSGILANPRTRSASVGDR